MELPMKGVWPPGSSISVSARLVSTMRRLVSSVATPLGMVSSMVSSSLLRASSVALAAGELEGGTLDGVTAVLQLAGHAVEAAHQIAESFGGALGDAMGVVSGGDGLHGVGQRLHGLGHLLGEVEREPTAGEERQRGHQQQEHHVEIAHLAAASVDAPVEVGGVMQAGHGGRDPVRHGQADDHGPALLQGGGAEGEVLIAEREDGLVAALREGEDGRVGRASDGDRSPGLWPLRLAAGPLSSSSGVVSGSQGLASTGAPAACGIWKAATERPSL